MMKFLKTPMALAATAVLLSFAAPPVNAQTGPQVSAAENGRLWFVELTGNPIADGNTLVAVTKEKDDFRRAAKAAKIQYSERRSFDMLFNGFSVSVDPRDRMKIAQLPGVKAIYPVELIQAPTPELRVGVAPDLASAIAMTGADIAQNTLGLTGDGVKVAVMDTGIDIDHPDFGGGGSNGTTPFPTARVAYGYDFVGDAFNGGNSAVPDDNPDDCGGHGTHVAGIVGANGTVKGVAPGVTFGAYRVFGCAGYTTEDIMITAMERALADGMHVLNMSIGGGFVWPQSPTAMAATRLVNNGMVVVASIGNSGASGLYSAGAPGLGEKVIGVASFDNVAGLISRFSSYGLSPDLSLKPDIGAPGGNIYSTYPLEKGGYATLSGTSMASPHVAGAAALILQAQPNTPAQAMRTILQNSADPKVWGANPGSGFLDNVHRQGAGMVDIDDAILATTRIEPGKISAGEGEMGTYTQRLTLVNKASVSVTYDLSFVNALSTGGVVTPSFAPSEASVAFSTPSVRVPAGSAATVDATITPATGPLNGQYGGYIVFTPQEAGQVYRVPFAGFVGDYQGIQVLTPTNYGFPWLARVSGGFLSNQSGGATYTMVGDDIPYFVVHLDHQSRRLRLEAFDAVTGKAWHRIIDDEYLARNSVNGYFDYTWDGTTFNGNGRNGGKWYTVPNGQYVVKLTVLKALGDENNPAHWEIWTSPTITIARP